MSLYYVDSVILTAWYYNLCAGYPFFVSCRPIQYVFILREFSTSHIICEICVHVEMEFYFLGPSYGGAAVATFGNHKGLMLNRVYGCMQTQTLWVGAGAVVSCTVS